MSWLRELNDEDPALQFSPLTMGITKTLSFAHQHGQISLTKTKAFKRSFVHWAAAEFDWPDLSKRELLSRNKLLNENNFQPLVYIHALMIRFRMARHVEGNFKLTKRGASMAQHPAKIFSLVAKSVLFGLDHPRPLKPLFLDASDLHISDLEASDQLDWANILNILNMETEAGITCRRARDLFYGQRMPAAGYDLSFIEMEQHIFKPLIWLGLLKRQKHPYFLKWEDVRFVKTPLWGSALSLPNDCNLVPVNRG